MTCLKTQPPLTICTGRSSLLNWTKTKRTSRTRPVWCRSTKSCWRRIRVCPHTTRSVKNSWSWSGFSNRRDRARHDETQTLPLPLLTPPLVTSTLLRSSTLHTNTTRHLLCTYTAPSPALERDLYSTVCCMLHCRPNRKTFVSCTYICTSSQCLLWAQTKQSLVLHSDEPRHCCCRHCASGRSEVADVYDRDNLLMRRRLCFLCVCSQGLWANQSVSVCAPQWLMATPSSSECETQNKGFEAECAKKSFCSAC